MVSIAVASDDIAAVPSSAEHWQSQMVGESACLMERQHQTRGHRLALVSTEGRLVEGTVEGVIGEVGRRWAISAAIEEGVMNIATSFWKMLNNNEAHADFADFYFENPGNFQFTTTVHNDTISVSFAPSVHPLHTSSSVSNVSFPSPLYSLLQWKKWATQSESSIVAPATSTSHLGTINRCLSTEPYSINGYSTPEAPGGETSGGGITGESDGTMATALSILKPSALQSTLDTKDSLGTESLIPPIAIIQDTDYNPNVTLTTLSLLDSTLLSYANSPV
ncbi:hypothetical protein CY34DRAFT_17876 [Suillus luteus UH-Slu-Lm8-n1]|uniref:Uncharacterized protein n=1 Tax=Suillus luteus UH-Slu-Lm8-n1 TaxID=930992 RepID=A0A0C9Z9P1_9AGAM|nr:hypothetical protein CY34DRAFT_17876 [Suillus luteus UH-Slu-Lm8-n1]